MKGGTQRITADGVIGVSGKPTRLYSLLIVSGAGAGRVTLYDGTDTTGTNVTGTLEGAANQGKYVINNEEGVYFPSGCFADFDAAPNAPTAVVASYESVNNV